MLYCHQNNYAQPVLTIYKQYGKEGKEGEILCN
jgi:hypothetical protein